jgi:16S rRNA (guanine(966)-N(2))-methyltransferase RsmD
VKEAVFNIAQPWTEDAVCLDLFAGTGSLGIEALSRGAALVYFCDNSNESLGLVMPNLDRVGVSPNRAVILGTGWKAGIARVAGKGGGVEMVFVDAPYALCEYYSEILGVLGESGALAEEARIFIERDAKADAYLDVLPEGMMIYHTRRYGNTVIDMILYEKEKRDEE